jgi:heme/copper-type cytochrome/quinol oxidase subunit 4
MKAISLWAARNINKAIFLIVVFELCRIAIGFVFGVSLPALSALTINVLVGLIAMLGLLIWFIFEKYDARVQNRFVFKRLMIGALSFLTFFLSILGGNRIQNYQPFTQVSASVETHYEFKKEEIKTEQKAESLSKKEQRKISKQLKQTSEENSSKAIGFLLLFMLAMVLTYLSLFLACSLACSEQGFLAILVFLLAVGIFISGLYFIGRIFRKSFKSYKEMTKEERRRERKAWWRTFWSIVMVGGLLALLSAMSNT